MSGHFGEKLQSIYTVVFSIFYDSLDENDQSAKFAIMSNMNDQHKSGQLGGRSLSIGLAVPCLVRKKSKLEAPRRMFFLPNKVALLYSDRERRQLIQYQSQEKSSMLIISKKKSKVRHWALRFVTRFRDR